MYSKVTPLKGRPLKSPKQDEQGFVARVLRLRTRFELVFSAPDTGENLFELSDLLKEWDSEYAWLQHGLIELRTRIERGEPVQEGDSRLLELLGGLDLMQDFSVSELVREYLNRVEREGLDKESAEELERLRRLLSHPGPHLH